MSFALPCVTSFMIILERANIEHRLMMITNTLQNLTRDSAAEGSRMMMEWQAQAMRETPGADDESDVALDVMTSADFQVAYNNMLLEYQVKEKALESEKLQLENRLASYNTMEEGIDQMIKDGAKDFAYGS